MKDRRLPAIESVPLRHCEQPVRNFTHFSMAVAKNAYESSNQMLLQLQNAKQIFPCTDERRHIFPSTACVSVTELLDVMKLVETLAAIKLHPVRFAV